MPDGRYFMDARRAVKDAKRGDGDMAAATAAVDAARVSLGERGPVWWDDGAPDLNWHLANARVESRRRWNQTIVQSFHAQENARSDQCRRPPNSRLSYGKP